VPDVIIQEITKVLRALCQEPRAKATWENKRSSQCPVYKKFRSSAPGTSGAEIK
jgi:hypothetical protein